MSLAAVLVALWCVAARAQPEPAPEPAPAAEPLPAEPPAEPSKKERMRALYIDPEDNAFDLSGLLEHPGGFLPLPVPITEPAIGYGAFVGGVFFIPSKDSGEIRPVPPSLAVAGAAVTSNLTWGAMAAYAGYWRHDSIRYLAAAGYGDLHLTWYGTGEPLPEPVKFRVAAPIAVQQIKFRLGNTRMFVGARYVFAWARAKTDTGAGLPGIEAEDLETRIGSLGLLGSLDSRDNTFTPNRGLDLSASIGLNHPWLGGSDVFSQIESDAIVFDDPMPRLVFGLRARFATVIGDVPFYLQPYVALRGVPALRYVGTSAISVEAEFRWDFWRRWSIVPFGGVGAAVSERALSGGSVAWGTGLGFRYLIARRLGLRMGLDVARGPEQFAVYVVFGSPWITF